VAAFPANAFVTVSTASCQTVACEHGHGEPEHAGADHVNAALVPILIEVPAQLSAERRAVIRLYYLWWTTAQIAEDIRER